MSDVTVIFFGGPKNGEIMSLPMVPHAGLKVPKLLKNYTIHSLSSYRTTGHYGPIVVDSGYHSTKAGHIVLHWCGWEDDQ